MLHSYVPSKSTFALAQFGTFGAIEQPRSDLKKEKKSVWIFNTYNRSR